MKTTVLLINVQAVRDLHKPRGISGVGASGVEYSYTGCSECMEHTPNYPNRCFVVSYVEYP